MAVVETNTETCPTESTWRKACFDNILWSPARDRAGIVCVMWKEFQFHHISIELMAQKERFMIFKYTNPTINVVCALVFVYAPPREADKETVWNLFIIRI